MLIAAATKLRSTKGASTADRVVLQNAMSILNPSVCCHICCCCCCQAASTYLFAFDPHDLRLADIIQDERCGGGPGDEGENGSVFLGGEEG